MSKPKDGVEWRQESVQSSYDISRKVKSLNTTRSKLLSYRKKCRIERDFKDAEIIDCDKRIADIEEQLKNIEAGRVIVSEHALLRYLSRYKGIDLDAISREIENLPEKYIIQRGNTIVTIIEEQPDVD